MSPRQLQKRITRQASVETIQDGWRVHLEPGTGRHYQLAQLDDYARLPRRRFAHGPPVTFEVSARASQEVSPGTWGFGFWNDPGPMFRLTPFFLRLPALPNAAWFFFAAPLNYLTLGNPPGNGTLVGVYSSPRIPSILLMPLVMITPFFLIKPVSRVLRMLAARIVRHQLVTAEIDPTEWHHYRIEWRAEKLSFEIDDRAIFQSNFLPKAPLALVLWLDNQYGAWRPDGSLGYGTLPVSVDFWVEIKDLHINTD
jgi:hypothetical protein